jgi:hypothetical protein
MRVVAFLVGVLVFATVDACLPHAHDGTCGR